MSRIRANQITNQAADGAPTVQHGLIIAGVSTFTGSVSIGGTLTYEDVTNIDSVGIITARSTIDAQGDVSIADKIIHTGDTNTFIRFPSNDSFSVTTNNVTRMNFTSNFIDLPDAGTFRLGNSNDLQIYHGSGGASNIVHSNTSQPLIISATGAGSIRFDTNSSERLRIASTGQVSISSDGTTDGLLTIKGNSDQVATPSIRLLDGSDTREVSITNTSGDFVVSVHGNDNAIHGHIKMFESGIIDFNNGGASGSNTNRLRIDTSGNVTKPYQPSFTARSTGTWSHGSSTGYLDIDINMVEEFDIGGNYNGQIFTAPVAGRYFFSYTFQYKCTSGYLVVSLRKGVSGTYNSYGRMHVYPPQQSTVYTGPGIIGIIDLAAGNTVKPVAEVNYAGNQIANVNFSGYLLG